MSNITSDFNNLLTNLTNNLNLITNSMTSLQTNNLDTQFVKKSNDYMTGTLNINDIDSSTSLNIGQSSNNIIIGYSTNSDIKSINIGYNNNNDNININSNINLNQNKITNLIDGTNNNDSVTLNQVNTYINTNKPTKLSQLTALNDSNISLNSYKLVNVANATNNTDVINVSQTNTLLPSKLSQLTDLNTSNLSLNSYVLTNVKDGTNNNDLVNLGQVTSSITTNKPTKLSQFTTANDSDISLNSYKITNVANGTTNNDVVNLGQTTTSINTNKPTKLSQYTDLNDSDINMNNYKITDLKDGTNNKDAVSLNQLNTLITTSKSSIPFSNINTYPSNNTNVFLGDGTFSKVTNNQITDGTINSSKLIGYPNDGTKYLAGDGTFKTVNVSAPNIPGKWELFMSGQGPSSGYVRQNTIVDKSLYPNLSSKIYTGYDNTITPGTLPVSAATYDIIYANGFFVTVSFQSGTNYHALRSIDGINWSGTGLGLSSKAQCIAYGNSFYVVMPSSSNTYSIVYSSDLITWTSVASALPTTVTPYYNSIAFGNGIFVSPARGTTYCVTSTNATTWTRQTLPVSANWSQTLYGNGIFLILADSSNISATSSNGTTWTQRTLPETDSNTEWFGKYLNGQFIIGVNNYRNKIYVSIDGINWETKYTYVDNELVSLQWINISYGNGVYYMISYGLSNTSVYSTDLTYWYKTNTSLDNNRIYSNIAYGNNMFIAIPSSSTTRTYKIAITKHENKFNASSYILPSTGDWSTMTYGNGTYLAIKNASNQSATSADGIIWTARTMPSSIDWKRVSYGNGLFVAIANNTTTYATSPDGITWTSRTLPISSTNWRAFIYGNKFVALSDSTNDIIVSSDGINWTTTTKPATASNIYRIAYGNNKYVVATTTRDIVTSIDAITWTAQTLSVSSTSGFDEVTFLNGQFILLDFSWNSYLATSIDGSTWDIRRTNIPSYNYVSSVSNKYPFRMSYDSINGIYLLVYTGTNFFLYSYDLFKWETIDLPLTSSWSTVINVNNRFLVTSQSTNINSIIVIENNVNTLYNKLLTSPTNLSSTPALKYLNGLYYAIVNNSSTYYTSINGITWTTRSLPVSGNWYTITYGNGLYIILADSSQTYLTSIDGINWTQRTMSNLTTPNRFKSFYYTGSYFVAVNYGYNNIIYSSDGITWTITTSPLAGGYCNEVSTNGSIYVLNSQGNTTYYTSPNGYNNWTARTFTSSNITLWQYNIIYAKGLFVGLNISPNYEKSKIIITSPDGINWTERTLPIGGLWYAYTFTNNMFIAFNYGVYDSVSATTYKYNGAYVYSSDGITWNYGYISTDNAYNNLVTDGKSILIQLGNSSTQYCKVDTFLPITIPTITEPTGFEYWMVTQ